MRRAGFTLIEMLVVITIIALLSGMVLTIMGAAQRASRRSATESVMHKVDTALRQFKTDFKAYPYQLTYPDLTANEKWTNNLYYTLGTDLTDDARDRVTADMEAAGRLYFYDYTVWNQWWIPSVHTFIPDKHDGSKRHSSWDPASDPSEGDDFPNGIVYDKLHDAWLLSYESFREGTCLVLNRMGAERARLIMLIGAIKATGVRMWSTELKGDDTTTLGAATHGDLTHHGRDLSGIRLLDDAVLNQHVDDPDHPPGWAVDYLQGEIDKRYIDKFQILDAYHHPLVYLCQVLPGVRASLTRANGWTVNLNVPEWYGLTISGRRTLVKYDPATGVAMAPDPTWGLPDPTNVMHSDLRWYAASGYEYEFELWSAGPDGRLTYMRDDAENRDNIPCEPYDKALR